MNVPEYDHTLGNFYLSRLATPIELTGNFRQSIFEEIGSGTIKVMLKIISNVPDDIKPRLRENEVAQALAYRLQRDDVRLDILNDYKLNSVEKVNKLKEYLSNAVIVFQLEQKNGHLNPAAGAQIKTISNDGDLKKNYDTIPYFNVDNKETLIKNFLNGESLNDYRSFLINKYFDTHLFEGSDCPSYVLIQEYDQVYAFGPLTSFDKEDSYILHFPNNAIEVPLGKDEDFLLNQYNNLNDSAPVDDFNTTCYFIDELSSQKIKEQFAAKVEQHLGLKETALAQDSTTSTQETPHENEHNDDWTKENSLEKQFLDTFEETTLIKGLYYNKEDLFNFHTAMKTGSLVILAGMSGTGKSKIVDCYAEALGLKNDDRYLKIAVRPFWQDDSDLLGYLDILNNVYRPGESELVDFLSRAEHQPEKLFIVCFDEMNLARVEHYFSQFLSVLEQEPGDRRINLYNKDFEGRLYNSEKYKSTLMIHDNVLFVGTVNLDESTYHFSDKVLDRANVIHLKLRNFADIYDEAYKSNRKQSISPLELSTEDFLSGTKEGETGRFGLGRRELEMLWEIHCALNDCNEELGVGLRIVDQISRYLICLPNYGPISRKEALDFQVVQRILSKVRGSAEQLKTLVGDGSDKSGTLFAIFNKYRDLSSFERTLKRVQSIAREIEVFGYTL